MDKLAKLLTEVIAFVREQLKVMLIALVLQTSKAIGSQIPTHQTTCRDENGNAVEANQ